MINKQLLETLLEYHDEKNRDLIRKQADEISKLIDQNRVKYDTCLDYRDGIDDVLKLVLQGDLVGGDNNEY